MACAAAHLRLAYVINGGNLIALQQILGHHDIKMTMVYAHLAPSYRAQDMARLNYATPTPARVIPIGRAKRAGKKAIDAA